jgi:hypothetical protein
MSQTLHTFSSEEYSDIAERMRRSAEPDFSVIIIKKALIPTCNGNGDPVRQGYLEKMQAVLLGLKQQRDAGSDIFVWSDADCLYIRPCADDIIERMADKDALFQTNGDGQFGTGFFASRTTDKMIDFWTRISKEEKWWGPVGWTGFEEWGSWAHRDEIRHSILPGDEYWTPCIPLHGQPAPNWSLPTLPKSVRMVHLSCVKPVDKRRIMSEVESQAAAWRK